MLNKEDIAVIEGLRAGGNLRYRNESILFERFKDFIRVGTYKYYLSTEDSTDAYLETIRGVIINIDTGKYVERTDKSLEAYAAVIFRNKCMDIIRKNVKESEPIDVSIIDNLPGRIRDLINEIIDTKELRIKINQCYKKLGEPCKKLLLHVEDGFSDKEIAEVMSYNSVDVAKQTRYTCRKKLAECLNLTKNE